MILTVGNAAAGGSCVARAEDGRVVFVRHALPGETVRVQVTSEGSKFLRADAVEVLTPASNWSSYPPHKHDEERPGESQLEEIYYFETAAEDGAGDHDAVAFGLQRVYGSGPGREIDVCTEVRAGDAVLVPHGWHGPSVAAPGYHLYYLNVMAGPGTDRAWNICDDPAHGWVRATWEDQEIDSGRTALAGRRPPSGHADASW